MIIAGIAVTVLALVMVFFVGTSVYWVSRRVSYNIKSRTMELISAYDTLIEQKSEKIIQLDEELAKRKPAPEKFDYSGTAGEATGQQVNFMGMSESMASMNYLDPTLPESYKKIKAAFKKSPSEVLAGMNIKVPEKGPATRLLETLDYDTVFGLSSLSAEEQLRLLKETLEGQDLDMLNYFVSLGGQFSSIGFYDYLSGVAGNEPSPVKLRIAPGIPTDDIPENVQIITDSSICEGFQIEADNVLYDYCVKEKEIS